MNKDKIFPLDLTRSTDELKALILEHPNYPIVVLAGEEAVCNDYSYTYCSSIAFGIGDILDCEVPCKNEKVYSDKDDFIEDMTDYLAEMYYEDMPDEKFEKLVDKEIAKYDPYWKKVICILVDN